jgi:hypothetical protein
MFTINNAYIDRKRSLNFITCIRESLGCEDGCKKEVPDSQSLDEAYGRRGLPPYLALQRYMCGLACFAYVLLEQEYDLWTNAGLKTVKALEKKQALLGCFSTHLTRMQS